MNGFIFQISQMLLSCFLFGLALVAAKETARRDGTHLSRRACARRLKVIESFSGSFNSGDYRPKCTKSGNFYLKQCDESIGCWCVDPETGARAKNTGVSNDQTPQCKPCHTEKFVLLESNRFPLPVCTPEGFYQPVQCVDGLCWCVDQITGEIFGDKVDASTDFECLTRNVQIIADLKLNNNRTELNFQLNGPNNETQPRMEMKSCEQLTAQDEQNTFMIGGYRHQCTKRGHFKVIQCHSSTGYCWCVDPETGKIASKQVPPGQKPQCSACHIEKEKQLESNEGLVPQCKENGDFHSIQCDSQYCWCVKEETGEIYGAKLNSSTPFQCTVMQVQQIAHPPPNPIIPVEVGNNEFHNCPIGGPLSDRKTNRPVQCSFNADSSFVTRCPETHFCNENTNTSYCCPIPPLPAPLKELIKSNCSRAVAQNFSNCLSQFSSNNTDIFVSVSLIQSPFSGNLSSTNFSSFLPFNASVKEFPVDNDTFAYVRATLNQSCELFYNFQKCADGVNLNQCPMLSFAQNLTDIILSLLCDPHSLDELLSAAQCFGLAAKTPAGAECQKIVETEIYANFSDLLGPPLCGKVDRMFDCLATPARNVCGTVQAEKHLNFMGNFLRQILEIIIGPECQVEFSSATITKCQKERNLALLGNVRPNYVPKCSSSTGEYEKLQCSNDGHECWCVKSSTGERLPGNKKFSLTC